LDQLALTFPKTPYKNSSRSSPHKSTVIRPKSADGKNQYFTKVHENAILEYASISDNGRKTFLYVSFIQPAFNEMVEKIVYTYKFNNLPNIEDLKSECKIFLTTILDKYDTNRGSKAFSYFSVITKNWFIHKVKKNNSKKEVYIEDIKDTSNEEELIYEDSYLRSREKEEFWSALNGEMDSWFDKRLKENEIKVYKAILVLFKESENIEIFNKKAIYLYVREITDLNTKQVVNNLKKFKTKYRDFKEAWDNGKI
jgi:DNA-directed RNA polymerase specialized sigma subunit